MLATESGCKTGDKCLFRLKNNQTKNRTRSSFPNEGREADDKCVGVVLEKPDLTDTIHTVHALRQQRTVARENECQSSPQRSPCAQKFENISSEKTVNKSDAPAARHGILPKIFHQLNEKRTKLHSIRHREVCIHHQTERIVRNSGAQMHMTTSVSKNRSTVVTANSDEQTRERATACVKELDSVVSSQNTRSFFTWETLRRLWVHSTLDLLSKTTSRQKWQND